MPKGTWSKEDIPSLAGNYNRYESVDTKGNAFLNSDSLYQRVLYNAYEIDGLFNTLSEISSGDLLVSDEDYKALENEIFGGGQ